VEEEISEVPVGHREDGQYQHARPGSYALVSSWANVSSKPGDDIEVQFYVQPYLLDVDHQCQALISRLDISSRSGFAVVLLNSKLEFLLGTGVKIEVLRSQFPVNRWRWLRVQMKLVGQTFTSSIRQLNRLAEKAPAPEAITRALSAPMVLGSNTLLFGAGMFETLDRNSSHASSFSMVASTLLLLSLPVP
jgi:hypothetical protein